MNVLNWKPIVHFNPESYGAQKPGLLFDAEIRCPCCNRKEKVRTQGQPLNKFNSFPLSWNLETEIKELEMQRECIFCGVVFSPVQAVSRSAFVQEVFSKVTQSWVDGEVLLLQRNHKPELIST